MTERRGSRDPIYLCHQRSVHREREPMEKPRARRQRFTLRVGRKQILGMALHSRLLIVLAPAAHRTALRARMHASP